MIISREIKNKIKKAAEEIIWEEKKKQELLNKEIDYNFLQSLIDKSNENQDLVITIYFKSGDRMVITQKYKDKDGYDGFDGNPATNELEVR